MRYRIHGELSEPKYGDCIRTFKREIEDTELRAVFEHILEQTSPATDRDLYVFHVEVVPDH